MSMTMSHSISRETNYGWFADAIGGIATAVLAIVGLAGVHSEIMLSIATIVFGVALMIEGGALLSEYAGINFLPSTATISAGEFNAGSVSALFAAGVGGVVLGVLAIIGIHAAVLTAISAIGFGCALVLGSQGIWHLHSLRRAVIPAGGAGSGAELVAGQMAQGSTALQAIGGLAAVVLGILAVVGINTGVLTLTAMLVVGIALVLAGSAASDVLVSLMHSRTSSIQGSSYRAAE
jgi:hypothetical protein